MSKYRVRLIMTFLLCVICIFCASLSAIAITNENGNPESDCAATITKYAVPGDSLTLTGPNPPQDVKYEYQWSVKDSSASAVNIDNVGQQTITFKIPTDTPKESYDASVYVKDLRTGGCALKSCVHIIVNIENTCSIIGTTGLASQICVTSNVAQEYQYTGTADLTDKKVAYLIWKVDGTTVASKDTTGQLSVTWSGYSVGAHNVMVEVHSAKGNQLLSSCTFPVTVLAPPDTTITPS
jgi:hypothetical protein